MYTYGHITTINFDKSYKIVVTYSVHFARWD